MIPLRDDTPRSTTPFVNYFIIALNIAIFALELLVASQGRGQLDALVRQFGIVPHRFSADLLGPHLNLSGALLPVLASMFLHASWLHIIGNMWALWIFGDNVEDSLGHAAYLVFYLLSGIFAGIAHIALNPGSHMPTVGASGAIAGVMGAYLVLFPRAKVTTLVPLLFFFTFWKLPAWVVLGYWFLLQFLAGAATSIAETSNRGGVAVWAHVGGFLAGMALLMVFPHKPRVRYGTW